MPEIKVKVDRVYHPPEGQEGDWFAFATDKGSVSGKMSWRPEPKEILLLEGKPGVYQGRPTFKFTSARAYVPIDPRDQLRYVCEVTTGFGVAMEDRIWETWGEDWQEKLKPEIVKGLKGQKFDAFLHSLEDFKTKREKAEAVAWMMGKGATVTLAQAAWKKWEKEVIGVVKSDCYRLADLPDFGFSNVDKVIRHNFGISDTDDRRIKAAVIYGLKQLTESGSTLINWFALKDRVFEIVGGMHLALINNCVRIMFEEGTLVPFPETQDIALHRDHENAAIIWEFVKPTELKL